ncbi:anti-sigma factor [Yoonia sp.]|uniref:anti-sigma factor n=1 Tax=Yoonia sp. TaxID=2212373 RepID=UPI0025F05FC2|nr:anti-sigma factor [Yoonia sp.]
MTDDVNKSAGDDSAGMEQAAEYALGLLTPDAASAFEAQMVTDPAAREAYAFWATTLASLTDDIAPVAPPKGVEDRINAALFGAQRKPRTILERLGSRPLAFAMTIMALTVLWVTLQPDVAPTVVPDYRAEIAAEDNSLIVLASFDVETRQLLISRTEGGARPGRTLQLWLIAGDAAPVSLGVLPDQTNVTLAVGDALVMAMAEGVLAISDEPLGGSPTGLPTGDVLAVGSVTRL